jgi:nucleoside-diphosphate-sugar epimerase
MKILLIGGTGLAGSYLLPLLVEKEHEIYAITRRESQLAKLEEAGATGIQGDIRDPGSFTKNLPGKPDLIVLLAMPAIRPGQRLNSRRKAALREETSDFFRNSMDLALQYGIPAILPGGTSYRTEGNEIADEKWPVRRSGITEIGADTDEMVSRAIETGKPGIIQLIYGRIYGNGGLFRFMYDRMEKGRFRIPGRGDNYIPNTYAGDAASAIVKAIEKMPVGEKFIITDDEAVTQREFFYTMAELMNKKKPGHVPDILIKWILGKDFLEVLQMSCRVSNAKAKRMLDWQPRYPSCKEGLEAAIREISNK